MKPELFWIPGPWKGRLAVASRPRGGDWLEDEVDGWRAVGLDVVLSLLERNEAAQLGLEDERGITETKGLQFLSLPIPDRGVPSSTKEVIATVHEISSALDSGKNVAVHCRQGIGRSGLLAAAVLMTTGMPIREAVNLVSVARGITVPETTDQLQWLTHLTPDRLALAS